MFLYAYPDLFKSSVLKKNSVTKAAMQMNYGTIHQPRFSEINCRKWEQTDPTYSERKEQAVTVSEFLNYAQEPPLPNEVKGITLIILFWLNLSLFFI